MSDKRRPATTTAALLSALVFLLAANISEAKYSGGTGEPNNPYRIETPNDLNDIGNHVEDFNKCFVMVNDIDLAEHTGTGFNIIGDYSDPFTGIFDGNGQVISNFSYSSTGRDYIGLFGVVRGENAQIRNVGLSNPNLDDSSGGHMGPLVGTLVRGTISDCYSEGGTASGFWAVGGLVGESDYFDAGTDRGGTILRCSSSTTVSASYTVQSIVGGLVGYNSGLIEDSFARGSVSGYKSVGGLVGHTHEPTSPSESGHIRNSYATGEVSGTESVGGLVGSNAYADVTNCYSAGLVTGISKTGGLAGENVTSPIGTGAFIACFWDVNTSGQSTSAGGTGKTTVEMQTRATFEDAGWDFTSPVWTMCEPQSYPHLWYENFGCEGYGGGSGTAEDPYQIWTGAEMNKIGQHPEDWDEHFKLMEDISLSSYPGSQFSVIGTLSEPFTGVFDGDGHTIADFTYESNGVHAIGLFGKISGTDAAIRDLGLIGADVNGGAAMGIGSLVGNVWEATISGCYCIDCNVSGGDLVGGLIGMNVSGTVSDCYATGQIEADETAGGLSGFNGGQVYSCYASASVLSRESGAGGLIGFQNAYGTTWDCYATGVVRSVFGSAGGLSGGNYGRVCDCHASGDAQGVQGVGGFAGASLSNSTISGCYSTGSATGTLFVGGLVGYGGVPELSDSYAVGSVTGEDAVGGLLGISIRATVSNCYAVGAVEGDSNVGGLVGLDGEDTWAGTFAACFWDSDINPDVNGIGNNSDPNVVSKSTAEMQGRSTFTDAGWDFVGESVNGPNDIWRMCIDGVHYPKLWWEFVTGDFACPDGLDFIDYSVLANHWRDTNCSSSNDCDRTDLDFSDVVDWADLKIFCDYWLEGAGP